MSTGITVLVGGVPKDLDEIFAAGSSSVVTGIIMPGGWDLGSLFRESSGGDTISFNTGITVGETDLRYLLRDINYVEHYGASIYSATFDNGGHYYAYTGDSLSFSITHAGGDLPLTWVWKRNGVVISGATTDTLTLSSIGSGDDGNYTVDVSNAYGSDSRSFSLNVDPPLLTTLTGPTTVTSGVFSGQTWNFSAYAPRDGLARVRFGIEGHGTGEWTTLSGGPTNYSGSASWSSPLGSPSIANTAGTYTFYFEAEDLGTPFNLASHSELTVTVYPP